MSPGVGHNSFVSRKKEELNTYETRDVTLSLSNFNLPREELCNLPTPNSRRRKQKASTWISHNNI